MPMPKAVPSISRPSARAKSPLPSDSMRRPAGTCWLSPQACITKGSFTAMQATSMPRSRKAWKCSTNPGRWRSEQVGVKAPGTANSTTLRCANRVGVSMVCTPSSMYFRVTSGIASPGWMGMGAAVWGRSGDRTASRAWCHGHAALASRGTVPRLLPCRGRRPARGRARGDRMQFKDYYAIPGVGRGAGGAEIKPAYRRLARKYHPDVSKEAGAEDQFKAVNEAYEALRDPARRKAYDQLRAGGYRPGDEVPPAGFGGGGPAGFDFEDVFAGDGAGGGFSDFFETLFRRQGGMGGRGPGPAAQSRGDTRARLAVALENVYRGDNVRIGVDGRSFDVRVPPGVRPGQVIRLARQGHNGGDLLLEIEYAAHPQLEVDGRNIIH